jgi:hypothetical protein
MKKIWALNKVRILILCAGAMLTACSLGGKADRIFSDCFICADWEPVLLQRNKVDEKE